ncbi:MerR family transcriptional regulator [Limosilactobacillus sp. RRLNB_1_1]|uniref:MerR family transcriptional regulator n=1 Tax=Limosilactobacillus albertensis TaxID=2759752 RepID=A0A7W3Y812_9LACO|nr:MerR family transcriptional regulator [Limosilactobacillus albertensis]MBB1068938.1 MerR family transcriptional regulator [Limosilactobacillus albertensis]MCD7118698.1 MerR family transcriptional regulator [Limosilactobacillus albertensis]MCD7128153.1 MerR family transcriptional regulator [Limosilactobacillus albertensis]
MRYLIGDVSKKTGIPASTLRYYDKHGLLPFVDRDKNGQRSFKDNDFNFLQVIQCMKQCGMSLKEIRGFICLCMTGDVTLKERYDILDKEETEVQRQIDVLQKQLAFLHYKMWYYKTSIQFGTEEIHMVNLPEGKKVDPQIHQKYLAAVQQCPNIDELIRFQNNYSK